MKRIQEFLTRYKYQLALAGILILAVLFRFWQLDELPPGLHPDEAANGIDALRILHEQDYRVVYNTNGPREALFLFLQAASVALLGPSIVALRVVGAVFGVLAVLAAYLWLKEWWNERLALFGALIVAIIPWSVVITRDGFRASMVPFFIALGLWLAAKTVKTRKYSWALAFGLAIGAGLYTYLSFRLFPIGLAFIVLGLAVVHRKELAEWWRLAFTALGGAVLAAIPLFYWAIRYPSDVLAARGDTSVFNPDLNKGDALGTLMDSVLQHLLMFNIAGDDNFRHNLGGQPAFNIFLGIMFLLGILVALRHIRQVRYTALLVLFGVMLLPSALTAEGIPHFLRSIGVLPIAAALAAIGLDLFLSSWLRTFPVNRVARIFGYSLVGLLLAISVYHGWRSYFVAWAGSPETYLAYDEDAVAIGRYLANNPAEGDSYIFVHGYTDITVKYLTYQKAEYTRLDPHEADRLPESGPLRIIVVEWWRAELNSKILERYPEAETNEVYGNTKRLFTIYEVPANE